MEKKIKIAYITKNILINGITTVVMNYCRNLDKDKYDIVLLSGVPVDNAYCDELETLKIRVYKLPAKKSEPLGYYMSIFRILFDEKVDIVHIHGNSATLSIELIIASILKIPMRIIHAHSNSCDSLCIHKFFSPLLRHLYTHGLACSKIAGEWMFGDYAYEVLPNGFETKKFVYNIENRNRIRKNLNLENSFVIGHVGRFNEPKNQAFVVDVFCSIAKEREDARLLLVGDGPEFERVRAKVNATPFKDRIILYGEARCVADLYNAMDIFVFPSKYEGLGIVLIEAQINGLPCVVSKAISEEVQISEEFYKLSLEDSIEIWKQKVFEVVSKEDRAYFYEKHIEQINKFDISKNVLQLEQLYDSVYNN